MLLAAQYLDRNKVVDRYMLRDQINSFVPAKTCGNSPDS